MSQEDRLSAIERRLAEIEPKFKEAVDLALFLGGSERVFQSALLAVLRAHPDKNALRPVLVDHVERALTMVLAESESEAHLKGAQDAHELILLALGKP